MEARRCNPAGGRGSLDARRAGVSHVGVRCHAIVEPDSSTGRFELVLRREQLAPARYGPNLILTIGDSRFAYYPRESNRLKAETGFSFRHAGVAGTDVRAGYYMVRDLDPTRRRYRAVVIGVDDYDDEDGAYDTWRRA